MGRCLGPWVLWSRSLAVSDGEIFGSFDANAGGQLPFGSTPVGMLDAQGVVDLLLESDVRVDFVRHGNRSVKAQSVTTGDKLAALHWSERTEPSARSPSVVSALFHLNFDSF
jgi:hypothetical protein